MSLPTIIFVILIGIFDVGERHHASGRPRRGTLRMCVTHLRIGQHLSDLALYATSSCVTSSDCRENGLFGQLLVINARMWRFVVYVVVGVAIMDWCELYA